MIHYLVAVGSAPALERALPRLRDAVEQQRVFDGEFFEHGAPDGTWTVMGLNAADPLSARRVLADGDDMVVFNGPVLSVGMERERAERQLLDIFRTHGPSGLSERISGSWNFTGITRGELHAFGDFTGQFPMYWASGSGLHLVSNRSRLASLGVGREGWDLRSLSWLVGQNLRGDQMPAAGARYLRPGHELHLRIGDCTPDVRRSPQWIWSSPDIGDLRDDLTSIEWDEITDALVANFAALNWLPQRKILRLTGGKDSRLSLALARAAGVHDLETMTTGAVDSPEVECAAAVAKLAGVEHKRNGPPATGPSSGLAQRASEPVGVDVDAVWRRLRQHTFRYESVVSPWDGTNDRLANTILTISGFGGELYKRGGDARLTKPEVDTPDIFIDLASRGLDPNGIRQAGIREHQRETLTEWVESSFDEVGMASLAEKWFIEFRLGHWTGALTQSKPGYISLTPLVSAFAAKKQMELNPATRQSHRMIFEVMRRVAPELASFPFMGDTWHESIQRTSPIPVADSPFPSTLEASRFSLLSWQNSFVEQQQNEIRQLFAEADEATDLGLIIDIEKITAALSMNEELNRPKFRQIISCIGIALALLGRGEQVIDHCP